MWEVIKKVIPGQLHIIHTVPEQRSLTGRYKTAILGTAHIEALAGLRNM